MANYRNDCYSTLQRLATLQGPLPDGMQVIQRLCEELFPAEVWPSLFTFDFTIGEHTVREWLSRVLITEPPDNPVGHLLIALFPISDSVIGLGCDVEIIGESHADPDEWHPATPPAYRPKDRQLKSPWFYAFYRDLYQRTMGGPEPIKFIATEMIPLTLVTLAVGRAWRTLRGRPALDTLSNTRVYTMWSGGDYVAVA